MIVNSHSTQDMHRSQSRWLVPLSDSNTLVRPKIRLIGFPYAGGSTSLFRRWPERLGNDIDLLGIQLPGRGTRYKEPPLTDFDQLVDDIAKMFIAQPSSIPMIFFGHSMGASVAFDVACELESRGAQRPELLVLSGRAAPSRLVQDVDSRHWSDNEMIDKLRCMQGTPEEVLDHPEMLDLLMPIVRADYELLRGWRQRETIWRGHILALAGRQDAQVQLDDVAQWEKHTSGRFEMLDYPGGHFFIHEQQRRVLDDMLMSIRKLVASF